MQTVFEHAVDIHDGRQGHDGAAPGARSQESGPFADRSAAAIHDRGGADGRAKARGRTARGSGIRGYGGRVLSFQEKRKNQRKADWLFSRM